MGDASIPSAFCEGGEKNGVFLEAAGEEVLGGAGRAHPLALKFNI